MYSCLTFNLSKTDFTCRRQVTAGGQLETQTQISCSKPSLENRIKQSNKLSLCPTATKKIDILNALF